MIDIFSIVRTMYIVWYSWRYILTSLFLECKSSPSSEEALIKSSPMIINTMIDDQELPNCNWLEQKIKQCGNQTTSVKPRKRWLQQTIVIHLLITTTIVTRSIINVTTIITRSIINVINIVEIKCNRSGRATCSAAIPRRRVWSWTSWSMENLTWSSNKNTKTCSNSLANVT